MIPFRILAPTALVFLTTMATEAHDLGVSEEALRSACTGDYVRLCSGIDPNADHVEACFRAKMTRVSAGCRSAIALYRVPEPTDERRAQQAEERRPR